MSDELEYTDRDVDAGANAAILAMDGDLSRANAALVTSAVFASFGLVHERVAAARARSGPVRGPRPVDTGALLRSWWFR